MTARTGATIDSDVVAARVREIRAAFPDVGLEWRQRQCHGLFRRVAIVDIEQDFARYKKNLILIGHHFAVLAEGIVLCRELGSDRLISGASAYQADEYQEQSTAALNVFADVCSQFSVSLETPIRGYDSLDSVKYQLLDFGVTTKSLESVSLFADSFARTTDSAVVRYLSEKRDIVDRYIALRTRRF
ncbi:MAG TPA: hypothetical protein VMA83_12450 [Solirubrobacteraceae bacterium]|nr:hypothetical protein [Solirubrobacteraceae bacterium]